MSVVEMRAQHRAPETRRSSVVVEGARWCWRVLIWMLILGFLAVIAAAVVVPRVAGATPYAVQTSSMEPTLPPGTLVVVKPTDVDEIGIGSVITYQLRSGEPTVVTHRVVEVRSTLSGEVGLQTQGDANDVPDAEAVRPVQVRGELWYSVPLVGHVNSWLTGQERNTATYGVAVLLFGYAGLMFLRSLRGRRERRS